MSELKIQKERLAKVLAALGSEAEDFCTVGGGAVWLYIPNANDETVVRPTDDVDFVVPAASRVEYYALDEKLRKLGFKNDVSAKAPMCRYKLREITVDFMPVDGKILSLSSRWFSEGLNARKSKGLKRGLSVNIFPLAYFLAAKFDAFNDRGAKDPRASKDLEDICTLLKYVNDFDLEVFTECSEEAAAYLKGQLVRLAHEEVLRECVHGHLGSSEDANKVLAGIEALE